MGKNNTEKNLYDEQNVVVVTVDPNGKVGNISADQSTGNEMIELRFFRDDLGTFFVLPPDAKATEAQAAAAVKFLADNYLNVDEMKKGSWKSGQKDYSFQPADEGDDAFFIQSPNKTDLTKKKANRAVETFASFIRLEPEERRKIIADIREEQHMEGTPAQNAPQATATTAASGQPAEPVKKAPADNGQAAEPVKKAPADNGQAAPDPQAAPTKAPNPAPAPAQKAAPAPAPAPAQKAAPANGKLELPPWYHRDDGARSFDEWMAANS